MRQSGMADSRPVRLKRYAFGIALMWTALIGLSLFGDIRQQSRAILDLARAEARGAFNKDLVYRRWAAGHGGVYVPVTEDTPPNPYLSHVEERDITTPSGRRLTLVNPAYMTRQVHELGQEQYGLRGHITSLNPIRPGNAPKPWEVEALQSFARGENEFDSVEMIDGEAYLRLMRPLITEERCLKCHAAQGYQVGDIRGGISVTMPLAPYQAVAKAQRLSTSLGHGMMWVVGLAGIGLGFLDLSRRAREQDQAQRDYRSLVNSIDSIVWEADARTFAFTFVSERAERLLGFPVERWLEEPTFWPDHIHAEDRERAVQYCTQATREKKDHEFEYRMIAADGRVVWLKDFVTVLVENDQPVKLRGVMVDISEQKRAEEALQRSNDLLDAMTHAQSLYISDADQRTLFDELLINLLSLTQSEYGFIGEILNAPGGDPYLRTHAITNIAWNQELREKYEIHATAGLEFRNLKSLWGAVITTGRPVIANDPATDPRRGGLPEGHPSLDAFLGLPIHSGEKLVGMVGIANRPDGYDEAVARFLQPFLTCCGSIIEAYRVVRERRKTEGALLEASRHATVGRLAATVAHEVNNPLAAIKTHLSILRQDVAEAIPEVTATLEVVSEQVDRIARTVQGLLGFARQRRVRGRPVPLGEVISSVARLFEESFRTRGIRFEQSVPADLPPVRGDVDQLQEVFVNILENARELLSAGNTVTILGESLGDEITVRVQNDGPGLGEDAAKVFEPFYTTRAEGIGLGLFNVKRICEAHGGSVVAENRAAEEGGGVCFRLTFPRAEAGRLGTR